MSVNPMPAVCPADRPLSPKEEIQSLQHLTIIESRDLDNLCAFNMNIGIFFDGTNNNKKRDQEDVLVPKDAEGRPIRGAKPGDPAQCSHSNIVVLYDAFKDKPEDGYFAFYVPGVGTPFPEVGEFFESTEGKAQGAGGDTRINWAMLQMMNAMHRQIKSTPMFAPDRIGQIATTAPLHAGLTTGANMDGKRLYFRGPATGKDAVSAGKVAELARALKSRKPMKLAHVNVSVFGFSRGAAQARAFCHMVHHLLLDPDGQGGYTLAGIPFRFQFLGLFDSVASVGMADSSPLWRGLGGWANGTLDIAPSVRRTVHLAAAHEARANFPLSSVRRGGAYPPGCVEKVYPGAHSDVGGGYPTGSQGKSVGSRSRLLSQMPLLDMYREARLTAVPLLSIDQLKADGKTARTAEDLAVDAAAVHRFNAYREWATVAGPADSVERVLQAHMQRYWQWRLAHLGRVNHLPSYAGASRQDQIDLWESDLDFQRDVSQALLHHGNARTVVGAEPFSAPHSALTPVERDFLEVHAASGRPSAEMPPAVQVFFDQMLHDSHASFYMVGPVTEDDRRRKIKAIEAKLNNPRILPIQPAAANAPGRSMAGRPNLAPVLSPTEQAIHDYQVAHGGRFPPVSDRDRDGLLKMEDFKTQLAVPLVTDSGRREKGGHVRYRRVFDATS